MQRTLILSLSLFTLACPGGFLENNGLTDRPDEPDQAAPVADMDEPAPPQDMVPDHTTSTPDTTPDLPPPTPDASPDMPVEEDETPDVAPDLPPPTPDTVPMFVGMGYMGRTTISCDDGQTWVANRSFDAEGHELACGQAAPERCYDDNIGCSFADRDGVCQTRANNCDCDHHPGAGTGITFAGDAQGGGAFLATFGWGPPGTVLRSEDGINWSEAIRAGTPNGLAYGQGRVILGSRDPKISADGGLTWTDGAQVDLQSPAGETVWNVRRTGYVPTQGGLFIITGESGERRDIKISADVGMTWWTPDTLPEACSQGIRSIAGNDTVVALGHRSGDVCVSTDGGRNFAVHNVGGSLDSGPLWDGAQFIGWARGKAYTSQDAVTWTEHDLAGGLHLGAVARNPVTGTFVAVRGGWKNWYDRQEFFRSSDGLTWTKLDAGTYDAGHAIRHITFGWAKAGTVCPTR